MTVFVALSGGVDSAVAAALLKRKGYRVFGVFMREYDLDLADPLAAHVECTQAGDRQSALAVAAHLGIPFLEWDFRRDYQKEVVDYMIREYKSGRTPNPDIMCNKQIKFGEFLSKARTQGADYIATGHYAKIQEPRTKNQEPRFALKKATDANKDQTYFLYTLMQEQLRSTLFPLGDLTKPEVRKLAKKFGLPNWDRKDSQGICFIGKLPMKDFLQTIVPPKRGLLIDENGKEVGAHDGAWYFTIGQRHGIGFAGGAEPYYVVGKDVKKNIVYVAQGAKNPLLYSKKFICSDVSWIAGKDPKFPLHCTVRTRYRQPLQRCRVSRIKGKGSRYHVVLSKPQWAVSPGQACVFYHDDACLGGGIIV
ncbi:tRNA 2-thiouridine(34) synthase MnmA [Candidatus Uhrbacteria bacterium]|nr:tRNA 2-thiouridine(34) synthase MnmA [Candidatus Uhrbacteria bacterium]